MSSQELCKQGCGTVLAKINGTTLREALKGNIAGKKFGKIPDKKWVVVCPKCDADYLRIGEEFLPFLCADGVMRTVEDDSAVFDFCGFRFSLNALKTSVLKDLDTQQTEKLGANIELTPKSALEFSRKVCAWSGGERVWGNLVKDSELGVKLNNWFTAIKSGKSDDLDAIETGTKIKGLGVSFASKHLRMLFPERFAVLDFVLSDGLGFALNTKGYLFFLRTLRDFQGELKRNHSIIFDIATIESRIFVLIRQQVRAQ